VSFFFTPFESFNQESLPVAAPSLLDPEIGWLQE
jgi:hypothetical protein